MATEEDVMRELLEIRELIHEATDAATSKERLTVIQKEVDERLAALGLTLEQAPPNAE